MLTAGVEEASVAWLLLQAGALVVVDVLLLVWCRHVLHEHRVAVFPATTHECTEDQRQSLSQSQSDHFDRTRSFGQSKNSRVLIARAVAALVVVVHAAAHLQYVVHRLPFEDALRVCNRVVMPFG